jgi:hypothetical protein
MIVAGSRYRLDCDASRLNEKANGITQRHLITIHLFVNLLPPSLNILRRFNPELYLAVVVAEHGDADIVINDNGLVLIPCEYEHPDSPSVVSTTMPDGHCAGYPRTETEFVGYGLHSLEKGSYRTKAAIFG